MGKGNENLVYSSTWDFKTSLTCRKILRHGTSGFTSHPKEGVLRNFIALKNPSTWPDSNPRPLGPVASILTTTPPKRRCTREPRVVGECFSNCGPRRFQKKSIEKIASDTKLF
jgi:hypothetical protein